MLEGRKEDDEEVKVILGVITILGALPIHAAACSCGVVSGDTVVQLKILTDQPSAQKIEAVDDRGRKRRLLKYEVAVLEVKRGSFESNYILTGYGGGDCGIKFEKNSTFTFTFWKKQFETQRLIGWCNIAKSI